MLTSHDIRRMFLNFFASKQHQVVRSGSLIPIGDDTLLFTNSGMVQFKDTFLGIDKKDYTRATTCQKSVRAGGKHNDLENVGFTARHHTFFEMLGNFSFGDYFKEDAIKYAWEFITEHLKLDVNRLYVTVHISDDESAAIWERVAGIAKKRIFRFDADNFWAMGETGPCGPCTEIFYDLANVGEPKDAAEFEYRSSNDLYVEFWNLVFMQFNQDSAGKRTPLPRPCVDTGSGLERVTSIVQGKRSNYETDVFKNLLQHLNMGSFKDGTTLDEATQLKRQQARQVIADHSRAITFLIADGVLPSNEGRGYVLRRILRRAMRYGQILAGKADPFLKACCEIVINDWSHAYPELKEQSQLIFQTVEFEERKFNETLEAGLKLLNNYLKLKQDLKLFSGEQAFMLYDTYGFPLDLTERILKDLNPNYQVDVEEFNQKMEEQRTRSKLSWKGAQNQDAIKNFASPLYEQGLRTQFLGYQQTETNAKLLAVQQISPLVCLAAFDQTCFYGESGGQIADKGWLVNSHGEKVGEVVDVQKPYQDLLVHVIEVSDLKFKLENNKNQNFALSLDVPRRKAIAANHSATHLLHSALKKVLGEHVKQAGSLVTQQKLRFDFTHFKALTSEQIQTVEDLVNSAIKKQHAVQVQVLPYQQAIQSGAVALFDEKYGDTVRVVQMGDFSTELCGGTHVANIADISLLKIVEEASVASGVRRIEALTAQNSMEFLQEREKYLSQLEDYTKSPRNQLKEKVLQLEKQIDSYRQQAQKMQSKMVSLQAKFLLESAIRIQDILCVIKSVDDFDTNTFKSLGDWFMAQPDSQVIILVNHDHFAQKATLLACVSRDLTFRCSADKIVRDLAPLIGGKGGGKANFAQAGGTQVRNIENLLQDAERLLNKMLNNVGSY